jgi:hypothetical protein
MHFPSPQPASSATNRQMPFRPSNRIPALRARSGSARLLGAHRVSAVCRSFRIPRCGAPVCPHESINPSIPAAGPVSLNLSYSQLFAVIRTTKPPSAMPPASRLTPRASHLRRSPLHLPHCHLLTPIDTSWHLLSPQARATLNPQRSTLNRASGRANPTARSLVVAGGHPWSPVVTTNRRSPTSPHAFERHHPGGPTRHPQSGVGSRDLRLSTPIYSYLHLKRPASAASRPATARFRRYPALSGAIRGYKITNLLRHPWTLHFGLRTSDFGVPAL